VRYNVNMVAGAQPEDPDGAKPDPWKSLLDIEKERRIKLKGPTMRDLFEKIDNMEQTMNKVMEMQCQAASQSQGQAAQQIQEPNPDAVITKVTSDLATSLKEAADTGKWVACRLGKWLHDKDFGFLKVQGLEAFVHKSAVRGPLESILGADLRAKIVVDIARGPGYYRAATLLREAEHIAEEATAMAAATARMSAEAAEAAEKAIVQANRSNGEPCAPRTEMPKKGAGAHWEYKDRNGKVQGLFTCAQMRNWYQREYFKMSLPVRCRAGDPFVELKELFPPNVQPFVPVPDEEKKERGSIGEQTQPTTMTKASADASDNSWSSC
jgi:hypothetical protein